MNSATFDEAVTMAAKQEDPLVAEIKQTLIEPVKELKALRSQWEKMRVESQTRLARVQQRVQQAVTAGVDPNQVFRLVNPLINDLQGGATTAGLIPSIVQQIDSGITNIERFSVKDVPLRALWLSWPNLPSRVRDNMHAVEERLAQLETIVADGGPLQNLVEYTAARKAGNEVA